MEIERNLPRERVDISVESLAALQVLDGIVEAIKQIAPGFNFGLMTEKVLSSVKIILACQALLSPASTADLHKTVEDRSLQRQIERRFVDTKDLKDIVRDLKEGIPSFLRELEGCVIALKKYDVDVRSRVILWALLEPHNVLHDKGLAQTPLLDIVLKKYVEAVPRSHASELGLHSGEHFAGFFPTIESVQMDESIATMTQDPEYKKLLLLLGLSENIFDTPASAT